MTEVTTITTANRTIVADRLAASALVLAALSAGAGLLIPGIYRDTEAWIRQARAADLVTLFAVVPVLAFGLWRASAGSAVGRLTALAALGYLVYNYALFGFSVAINAMTPAHIAVLGLATWSLALNLVDLSRDPLRAGVGTRLPRRTTATFLVAVSALFASMWLGQIVQAIASGAVPEELANLGLATNPVYTLDLAFALPFLVVSGIAAVRLWPAGAELALVALAWVALMGLGVLAIFAFDAAAGAAVPLAVAAGIGLLTVIAIALTTVGLMPVRSGSTVSVAGT